MRHRCMSRLSGKQSACRFQICNTQEGKITTYKKLLHIKRDPLVQEYYLTLTFSHCRDKRERKEACWVRNADLGVASLTCTWADACSHKPGNSLDKFFFLFSAARLTLLHVVTLSAYCTQVVISSSKEYS